MMRAASFFRLTAIAACALLLFTGPSAAQSRSQAQPDVAWWDRALHGQSRHYWIKSDLPPREARELANHLDLMYEAYNRRLGSLPQRMPDQLNVLIFQSRDEYIATLGSRYNVNAMGTGGVFMPNHATLAFWTENLPRQRVLHVLQHEGFHQFAYSRFGHDLPPWVNEGLAEFFGEAVMVGRTLVIGQSKPRVIEAVRDAVERGEHIPFRDMLTMSQQRWNSAVTSGGSGGGGGGGGAALQYHQAWSMVHFLIYGNGGRYVDAFERYLRLIANAVPSEEAFIRAFDTEDFDAFEQRWREYIAQARPSSFVTALERAEFLAAGMLELSRRKIYPKSLDDLKAHLREIDFRYVLQSHGAVTVLSADDEEMFTIPIDEHAREQPAFVVVEPPRRRGQTLRQRQMEDENPTPPSLATEHLRPHRIILEWKRDERTNTFSYELIVR